MSMAKIRRMSLSLFAGYILGITFSRFSFLWANAFAPGINNIPKHGFPVQATCLFIVTEHGWYTLLVVSAFMFVAWVWTGSHRDSTG